MKKVATIFDGNLSQGEHDILMELKDLKAGEYFVQIQKESGNVNTKLLKMQ